MTDEEYYWEKAEFQDPLSHRRHVENYKKGIRSSVAFDERYAREAAEELLIIYGYLRLSDVYKLLGVS